MSVLHQLQQSLALHELDRHTDGQLLDRFVARRDEAAFALLVRRFGPMVLGVCRRVLGNEHDAEDAFQATFLVLARKGAVVRPRDKVGNWLYGVACRTAREARVMAARRVRREKPLAALPEPSAAAADGSWLAALDAEVERLPEKYRLPIVLCELQGKTLRQAAEQLGCPEGTVAGRLSRARNLLAEQLRRRGVTSAALGAVLAGCATANAVAPTLAEAATRSAVLFAQGAGACASATVTALAEGGIKAMLMTRLKLVVVTALVLALLGGAGAVWHHAAADPPANDPPADKPPAAKKDSPDKAAAKQAPRGKSEPAGVPLAVRLIAKQTSYTLDLGGKTAAQYRRLLEDIEVPTVLPAPPAVDLVFELENTGDQPIEVWVDGDPPELKLKLEGPGAFSIPSNQGFRTVLLTPKSLKLEPGKKYQRPVRKLAYGFRGLSHHAYWLEPGEYTLTASFETAVSPAPRDAVPPTETFGRAGFGKVRLIADPVKLRVKSSK
ncbi:MAG TPA: sigma-70 family RNA polymerase sigma factor [Gemmataceae bacterium]|nr:sigma-70 family RNA polymerase sigma factor [Gemmataceae bacterium]